MSTSSVIDRRGSPLCVAPFERHEFVGADYECLFCDRPRAMHAVPESRTIPSNADPSLVPIRSMSFSLALRTHPLTNRDIAKYETRGYYSPEFREARRAFWEQRKSKRSNFSTRDGRLIYCP